MYTLLLTPRATEETARIAGAAKRRGITVVQGPTWHIPALDPERVLLYGGEMFLQLACQELGMPLPVVDPTWLPSLSQGVLHRRVSAMEARQARMLPGPIFVKPIQNKSFPPAVYRSGQHLPVLEDLEPVYVSEPVVFEREYRCFLHRGMCRTGSLYSAFGHPATASGVDQGFFDAARMAEVAVRERPTLPDAVVVDVGVLTDGRFAVVEPNSVAESALYGANEDVVLELIGTLFGHELATIGSA